MLDLGGDICYNGITSERFFFFCIRTGLAIKEPYLCFRLHLFVRRYGGFCRTEGGVYFYGVGFPDVKVKAKNISVKREVPL